MRRGNGKKVFQKNFLRISSTSSMQIEGAVKEEGEGKSVYDTYRAKDGSSIWDTAIDEYHRYPEDLNLYADLGINCYRFQISWSKVNPLGDGNFMPFSYYQSSTM